MIAVPTQRVMYSGGALIDRGEGAAPTIPGGEPDAPVGGAPRADSNRTDM